MTRRTYHTSSLGWLLALTVTGACAQLPADNPDWTESEVPPPPAFDVKRLIPLDVPRASSLALGIDPATLTITRDGVVRYVVVASSPGGGMNVMYEGIRCTTAQYRVYARYHADSGWTPNGQAAWQSLYDPMPSKHPLNLARSGVCTGRAPNSSPADIVRALTTPASSRFN
jgi:CNP1-like family